MQSLAGSVHERSTAHVDRTTAERFFPKLYRVRPYVSDLGEQTLLRRFPCACDYF